MMPQRRMCTLRELRRGLGEALTGHSDLGKASMSLCSLKREVKNGSPTTRC